DEDNGQTLSATSHSTVFNYVVNNIYHSWVDIGNPPASSVSWSSGGTNYSIFKSVNALTSTGLAAGHYRLRIDMLDYQGLRPLDDGSASECSRAHKGYALQLSTKSGGTYSECSNSGCTISAIDELAIYTPIISTSSNGFDIPLFALPSDYAGQTVDFYVFDVGDVSGPNQISIINPDATSCGGTAPCTFTSSSGVPVYDLGISRNTTPTNSLLVNNEWSCASTPQIQPNTNSSLINTVPPTSNNWSNCSGKNLNDFYDGRWLMFQLNIPTNYAGAGGAYWEMQYSLAGTTSSPAVASDTFTLVVNYSNTPVHLLP
ncbi:MAG: hypothetical protein JOZ92_00105, partial [Candidatus Dormibacteraeota bacterium]|nr:hypothetical protein [Candidatus Dormibacteraeota bacterium]